MKKILLVLFVINSIAAFSQIKVYTGGKIAAGSTSLTP
jgi:hypothetical protein